MSADGRGKVRYCGSWVIVKLISAGQHYIRNNLYSTDSIVFQKIQIENNKKKLISHLRSSSKHENENSKFNETPNITDEKQFRNQSLGHIGDS